MSEAWFYAIALPPAFLAGWFSTPIWVWIINKIIHPGGE